jgi:hypothetical protein
MKFEIDIYHPALLFRGLRNYLMFSAWRVLVMDLLLLLVL